MTNNPVHDLKLWMESRKSNPQWTREEIRGFVSWFDEHTESLPAFLNTRLKPMRDFFAANPDAKTFSRSKSLMLLREMGIISSSERRRTSGKPLAGVPQEDASIAKGPRARLEEKLARCNRLGTWHGDLRKAHDARAERLTKRIAKMPLDPPQDDGEACEAMYDPEEPIPPLEQFRPTGAEKAECEAAGARFADHVAIGNGKIDPELQSVNETLMPGGAVLGIEEHLSLKAEIPERLKDSKVVKTLIDERVRYDFALTVKRIELDVEKKVIVTPEGERKVISASTSKVGPPRYSVTWSALATLAVMVGQFAIPFNRLGTMLSAAGKRFTAASLSRMVRYVAVRLVPIYLELARQVSQSDIVSGDDTNSRVLEVDEYFAPREPSDGRAEAGKSTDPPWVAYCTPEKAARSEARCAAVKKRRIQRREDGDREARHSPEEDASLGILIGRELAFESPRRDGNGGKRCLHTTVVSGRSVADDPRSLIVFYRSHLGGFGNLLESLLRHRSRKARDLIVQTDLSTANLVTCPELLSRFSIKRVGCGAHARRPFALYEHEDVVYCSYMLHLFTGLAIHESELDNQGRNRENVLAVRQDESRTLWFDIKRLAEKIAAKWSKKTKLGVAARYILKHFKELTAYLDDPRLEATNNLRERMLRLEKLIESSSMFRRSLEGRFALDVVRTVLQTAVAADVPVHKYIESVLRADPDDIAAHPERFTPRSWVSAEASEE